MPRVFAFRHCECPEYPEGSGQFDCSCVLDIYITVPAGMQESATIHFETPGGKEETISWDWMFNEFDFSAGIHADGIILGNYFVVEDDTLPPFPGIGTIAYHDASGHFFGYCSPGVWRQMT